MSRHRAWDGVEVCRPTATRFEFVGRFVKWSVAGSAGIDASTGHVFVKGAFIRGFCALLTQNAELLCDLNISRWKAND